MNILLFGSSGQVGWELQRSLAPLGNVIAVNTRSEKYCGDLTNPQGIVETIRLVKPDIIVNAAAYTAVDKAETERENAELLNAKTVQVIAAEADALGAWLIHYSTDYVFPGSGETPWTEGDTPSPLNFYGESKLAGEKAIQQTCTKYLIFRTSWVYSGKGNNFAKTILNLAKTREQISIINDQFGAPTGAELLADCTAHAIIAAIKKPELAGLYHLVSSGMTTWFDYANLIIEQAKIAGVALSIKDVIPVPTSAYPTAAQRPLNSRLDTSKFRHMFDLNLPNWESGVKRMLGEMFNSSTI